MRLRERFPTGPLRAALEDRKTRSGKTWALFLEPYIAAEDEAGVRRLRRQDFRRLMDQQTVDPWTVDRISIVVFGVAPEVFYPDFCSRDEGSGGAIRVENSVPLKKEVA